MMMFSSECMNTALGRYFAIIWLMREGGNQKGGGKNPRVVQVTKSLISGVNYPVQPLIIK